MSNFCVVEQCAQGPETKGGGGAFQPVRRLVAMTLAGLSSAIVILTLGSPVFAQQNPCAEQGPDCRLLTPTEVSALKARLLAVRAVLPVPDPARWAPPPDVGEAYTMPFIAEVNLGGSMISGSWPAGAFTERNEIDFIFDGLDKSKAKAKDAKNPLAGNEQMQAAFGNRIEVLAKLLPYAYLVDNMDGHCVDVSDPEATEVEKTPTFLSWISNEGTNLTMIFGPRTCREAETERIGKPARNLAPVKCIVLEITGPNKIEIAALKKKVNRQAFEKLLGPM